jgi:uncharacterized protein (TIGR03083 family)
MEEQIPIPVSHLFPLIDRELIMLLKSLSPDEWEAQTIASRWKVKDVAAHLLDGNLRALSLERDHYFGNPGPANNDFETVVDWLNQFNQQWVDASRRLSPDVLLFLLEQTGPPTSAYFASVDPFSPAVFPVLWAGEEESKAWMHLARQYTEKWLHQQQIRDALNKPGIMTQDFYHPFIETFFRGLPHTFRGVESPEHTSIKIMIPSDAGGTWMLIRNKEKWNLISPWFNDDQEMNVVNEGSQGKDPNTSASASEVIIDPDMAWKLFSKSVRPADVETSVRIMGNQRLGQKVLEMVSVMA